MAATTELMDEAKKYIAEGNFDSFFELIGRVEKKTEEVPQHVGLLERQEYTNYGPKTVHYEVPLFDENDKRDLFKKAKDAKRFEILAGFAIEGYHLQLDEIKKLAKENPNKDNPNNHDTIHINMLMKDALKREVGNVLYNNGGTWEDKIKLINEKSIGTGFSYNTEQINAIRRLVEQYPNLAAAAKEEINPYNSELLESGNSLNTFNWETRKDIIEYISGGITYENFLTNFKKRAEDTLDCLEKHSSGWESVKNYLLTIESVAPIIKMLFEDTMVEKVKLMKNSLAGIKAEGAAKTAEVEFSPDNPGPKTR